VVSQLILFISGRAPLGIEDIPTIFAVCLAFSITAIIMCTSMRDPRLPIDHISPPFQPSRAHLRSPEDNLTPWQFMTVSWLAPLISLGSERQLNDEDVWSLAYEFQHRLLHDRFRELRGTVLKRLLCANGVDLVLISFLGLTELLASMCMVHIVCRDLLTEVSVRSFGTRITPTNTSFNGRACCAKVGYSYLCRFDLNCSPGRQPSRCSESLV